MNFNSAYTDLNYIFDNQLEIKGLTKGSEEFTTIQGENFGEKVFLFYSSSDDLKKQKDSTKNFIQVFLKSFFNQEKKIFLLSDKENKEIETYFNSRFSESFEIVNISLEQSQAV